MASINSFLPCSTCKKIKSTAEFGRRAIYKNRGGYDYSCKQCESIRRKPLAKKYREQRKAVVYWMNIPEQKFCPRCHQTKSIEDFPRHSSQKYGVAGHCKECNAAKQREYKKTHPTTKPTNPAKLEQWKAWKTLIKHVSRGKIVRQSCEVCGAPKAQAHHWKGYAKEHIFDVKWLCQRHHSLYHYLEKLNHEASGSSVEDLSRFFSIAHSNKATSSPLSRSKSCRDI